MSVEQSSDVADQDVGNAEAPVELEYVRMYYEHQYERMGKTEDHALAITNYVVTLTVVALTFGFSSAQGSSLVAGLGLPFVLALANGFAIFYIVRAHSWIRTYELRAKRTLQEYFLPLWLLDQGTTAPHKPGISSLSRWKIQVILHGLLIVASLLIPVALYVR